MLSLTPNSYDRKHIEEHLQVKRLSAVTSATLNSQRGMANIVCYILLYSHDR